MRRSLIFLGVLIFSLTVFGQTRQLERPQSKDNQTEKRIALVIGNGSYQKAKALPNPTNDAEDMTKTLKDMGFEVLSGVDLNKRQMEILIRQFGNKLASGGIGLFYYAGHGIQVAGENYLVPVDAEIPEEDEVSYSAVPLGFVLTKMMTAKNDLNIVILDACRNNPFARSWRNYRDGGNNDGLAKISPPTGTLVLYATEPGKIASDGAGRNGLFTESLLKEIKKPNVEYDQLVKNLSADVWQRSNRQQLPWKEGNSLQDFYFLKISPSETTSTKTEKAPEGAFNIEVKGSLVDRSAGELSFWDEIKTSTDTLDFEEFLKSFPDGIFAATARLKLRKLREKSNATKSEKSDVSSPKPSVAEKSNISSSIKNPEPKVGNKRVVEIAGGILLMNLIQVLQTEKITKDGQTIKLSLEERNRISINGVKLRGVNFEKTPEIERQLKDAGANEELLKTIRNSQTVENFYLELNKDLTARGVIINYGTDNEVSKREADIRKTISAGKFDISRITFVRGGVEPGIITRYFIVPAGVDDPTP